MSEENGAHVTWRELNLALKPVTDALARIEFDFAQLAAKLASDERATAARSWFGPRGTALMTGAVKAVLVAAVSAATATGVSLLFLR